MAKMIVVNEERCLGCRSCELACALAHSGTDSLLEALAVRPKPRVHVEPVDRDPGARAPLPCGAIPLQCRHCEDAPCMAICPTGAVQRPDENGPVLVVPDQCIGCKFCLMVCPFGVIDVSRDGKAMIKCDQCIERTEAGEDPACVVACPTGALKFVDVTEHLRGRRRQAAARIAAGERRADQIVEEADDGS